MSELDALLEIAGAAGDLESGRRAEDVAGGPAVAAVAAQHVKDYREKPQNRRWTAEEEAFLEASLGYLSREEIARRLDRTPAAIRVRWRRLGFDAPSKQPDELTANQVAETLGVDIHAVCRWIEAGVLPARKLPLEANIWAVKKKTLYRWAVNPRNWPYFENSVYEETLIFSHGKEKGTQRITDPHLRRLVERQKERWDDAWWSTEEIAQYHGVDHRLANKYIHDGVFETAVKVQNWRVLRSEAVDVRFITGRGRGGGKDWSREGDAWLVLARAVGLTFTSIEAMGFYDNSASYRLGYLHDNDLLPAVALRAGVYYHEETGELWASWRHHAHRLPGVARAVGRFLDDRPMTSVDRSHVCGIMASWARWFAAIMTGDEEVASLARSLTYGGAAASRKPLWERYQKLREWGMDPFAGG